MRLAGFSSAITSLVPRAVTALAREHPGLQISLTDTHPPDALELLRAGPDRRRDHLPLRRERGRAARRPPAPPARRPGLPAVHAPRARGLAALRDATWIAGCERCSGHLRSLCADAGFEPRVAYTSDDMVVMQELVAAGLGVTTIPGLALAAHRAEGIVATRLRGSQRRIYAATYGDPPDPPATAALLAALAASAASVA